MFCPVCGARFTIIPLWHKRPGRVPLTSAIWLSNTTLGYTVAHSAIDWGVESQLFNTSEQQVLLSSWPFSCFVSAPPKNVSYLFPSVCWFKPDGICPHSPCDTPLYFWCNPETQTGCSWDMTEGDLTLVSVCNRQAFRKYNFIWQRLNRMKHQKGISFPTRFPVVTKDWQRKIKPCVPYH